MSRRHVLSVALLVAFLAIPLVALNLGPSDSVNARTISRLQLSMTEREVEGILGRPYNNRPEVRWP